jgi:hydrogenase expression/formation protein HypD
VRFVDEFRDPAAARALVAAIADVPLPRPVALMEVCGGHTHTIYRHGLEHLLPDTVELVHGPGCPVCVIPTGRVDDAIWLAEQPGVVLTTFADMMRVPGSSGSLLDAKARGADVRFVYSPLDALRLAGRTPDRHVVFFAVGFETTAPSTAVTLLRARDLGIGNFSVFSNHVTIGPPLEAILDAAEVRLDGFLGPGHVATVTGLDVFEPIVRGHGIPLVVAGFEPLDVLQAVHLLLRQVAEGRAEVENQYGRVVRRDGNREALALMARTLVLRDAFEWRGLGDIPRSGLGVHPDLARWDTERRFDVPGLRVADHRACQCGSVLRGVIKPWDCKVFGRGCTPERPLGTCMVSPEGACAAYYTFGRTSGDAADLLSHRDDRSAQAAARS